MAKLTFYYGTMNSLKSAMLLSTAYAFKQSNRTPLLIGNKVDTRSNTAIASRIGISDTPDLLIGKDDDIVTAVLHYLEEHSEKLIDVILVDEIQFFTEKQIEGLAYIVDTYEIETQVYGLKTDFQSHLFPATKKLIEIADSIREVKSICTYCTNKATLNLRIDENNQAILDGELVQVGGNESYIPVCRSHYNSKIDLAKYNQLVNKG